MLKLKWLAVSLFLSLLLVPLIMYTLFYEPAPVEPDIERAPVFDMEIQLYRSELNEVQTVNCYEYICAVVAGEMPANFEKEALKAQAVAAFTYTVNKMNYVKNNPDIDTGHSGGYVCDDYAHCKAYLPKADAKEKWGDKYFDKNYPNIEAAVSSVLGKVITYDGAPINAVFHSISGGVTASAYEVWGSDIPYLQSVECQSDKEVAGFESECRLTATEFANVFYEQLGVILSDDPSGWLDDIKYYPSGQVEKISIGGTEYAGTYIRKLFSLRSASFDFKIEDDSVTFTVRGYGHGVGMSQNGANAMAKQGDTYDKILKYFYTGTELSDYSF